MDLPERGSLHVLPVPALPHQVKDLLGAILRQREVHLQIVIAVEVAAVLNHLFIRHVAVGLVSGEVQNLPQRDREGPHITLG